MLTVARIEKNLQQLESRKILLSLKYLESKVDEALLNNWSKIKNHEKVLVDTLLLAEHRGTIRKWLSRYTDFVFYVEETDLTTLEADKCLNIYVALPHPGCDHNGECLVCDAFPESCKCFKGVERL